MSVHFISENFKAAMIYLNIHPVFYYLVIAIIIVLVAIIILSSPKKTPAPKKDLPKKAPTLASHKDITAIAGDDIISTQLDLAKAYLEMDQKNLAKQILTNTLKCGNSSQKSAAKALLETL